MERAGQRHDAEKRHVGQTNDVGGEGKFVFVVAEFWYEPPLNVSKALYPLILLRR